ncbi:hypothetical protein C2845_PM03G35900 [Panicum miliaceum]|uniref:Uncharacterized protein n=1 Tax=Panicum miliaceum TaxID=4540 RepID=A0A3L6TDI5_PANMI|nr:hypothetical protein C2845_PM03G35900 [Panicum miliaceum]
MKPAPAPSSWTARTRRTLTPTTTASRRSCRELPGRKLRRRRVDNHGEPEQPRGGAERGGATAGNRVARRQPSSTASCSPDLADDPAKLLLPSLATCSTKSRSRPEPRANTTPATPTPPTHDH